MNYPSLLLPQHRLDATKVTTNPSKLVISSPAVIVYNRADLQFIYHPDFFA